MRTHERSMRPIRDTIPLHDARALVLDAATPIARTERVALRDADGRVVAAPAMSARDVPPFDRAAMDGFAVRAEDTFGAGRQDPRVLRAIETVFTGQVPAHGDRRRRVHRDRDRRADAATAPTRS